MNHAQDVYRAETKAEHNTKITYGHHTRRADHLVFQYPRDVSYWMYWNLEIKPWFIDLWGYRSISVGTTRRTSEAGHAVPELGMIYLRADARTQSNILHEMAHCLAPKSEYHGPVFTRILLILWENVFGADAAETLRASYEAEGVKVLPAEEYNTTTYPPACPEATWRKPKTEETEIETEEEELTTYTIGYHSVDGQTAGVVKHLTEVIYPMVTLHMSSPSAMLMGARSLARAADDLEIRITGPTAEVCELEITLDYIVFVLQNRKAEQ